MNIGREERMVQKGSSTLSIPRFRLSQIGWWGLAGITVGAMVLPATAAEHNDSMPKIIICNILPKEISYSTEVTVSFDYENVKGGLKNGKMLLLQKIQLPGEEKIVTRTSNWQPFLADVSGFPDEAGHFEKRFVNPERWRGPPIELTYEIKIVDEKGRESAPCSTKITPK